MIVALRRLLALAAVPTPLLALSLLLGALAVAFGVALMTTAGYLVSRAAEQPPILTLTTTIVAVRFFGLGRPLLRYLDRLASHDMALRSLGRIRTQFYARIEPLAPAGVAAYRSGDLLTRMVGDVDVLQGLYLRCVSPPVIALAVGAACVGAATVVLPAAGLVLAVGLLVAGVAVPTLTGGLARRSGLRRRGARALLTAELVEVLGAAPELVVYGQERATLDRVRRLDADVARLGRRDARVAGLGEGLLALVAGATVAGVLALAVSASSAQTLDRVLVAALALLALSSFDAVAPLPGAARELSEVLGAGSRVLALSDRSPTVAADPTQALSSPSRAPDVALEGVTARYPGADQPALVDVDLRLDAGRRIALLGPSGAGKTTVTSLLLRFIDPGQGRVTIDGRDVRDYRQEDVRGVFAVAGQEAHVFSSTIRENLRLASPGADDAELLEALGRARLREWVERLPDGLDTLVGEAGAQLSGGQRQRLTIARALLSNAPVLVLDEPSAHLDPETAERLVRDVFAAAGDRSILLVTHRPEGLDLVDEVVTLGERRARPSHASDGGM